MLYVTRPQKRTTRCVFESPNGFGGRAGSLSAPPSCNRRRAPTSNGKGAEEGQEKGEAMERERERGEKEGRVNGTDCLLFI